MVDKETKMKRNICGDQMNEGGKQEPETRSAWG